MSRLHWAPFCSAKDKSNGSSSTIPKTSTAPGSAAQLSQTKDSYDQQPLARASGKVTVK
eukprot:CAMPEP_0174335528 /NCGR_PEP_ID=MMETSP0810-20121108/20856_1 /TAXON_ID=73025 ORGANISM="Eutreptiella gymnastica-like, Strain CCMP1594" /NCGR_SAMPLE_ID=MMETSP0810 /ASSEMBLY_ACC=CAM_ASM_000659 /LENGTH=58 /DNA_ID=CAMNT_0015453963 /DNA_START=1 /DNA_END=177 /DNA_ORIENTATION=+